MRRKTPPETDLDWQQVTRRRVVEDKVDFVTDREKTLRLHRFCLVGKDDRISITRDGLVYVFAEHAKESIVQVKPTWRKRIVLPLLNQSIKVTVKEIETGEELAGYEKLIDYHYKTGPGPGRRAPLIAKTNHPSLPSVVGFVEICSTFLVNVPRKYLFDRPFEDRSHGIKWDCWDIDTAKRYLNVTARISRCVVLPELRGLGFATLLTESAALYAAKRWHFGGHRPTFLEITAEMLRYWPFVRKSGFIHIGDTQGNEARLQKTMAYLLTRKANGEGYPRGGGGIMTMHRAHANMIDELMHVRGWSEEHLRNLLSMAPEDLNTDDWIDLHSIYRRPKPVYMKGLTREATAFIQQFEQENQAQSIQNLSEELERVSKLELTIHEIEAWCDADESSEARRIQEAFGIVSKTVRIRFAVGLHIHINSGQTLLIAGPSGSGKSLLLKVILWYASGHRRIWRLPTGTSSEACLHSHPQKVETWRAPNPSRSPIAILASMGLSLEKSMQLLAAAGMAEASLFIRPSRTLSTGQYYRLGLAIALAKEPDLLVIDEFCESLDDFTTAAVCRRLGQTVKKNKTVLVVATSNAERISKLLSPTKHLNLHPTGSYRWVPSSSLPE